MTCPCCGGHEVEVGRHICTSCVSAGCKMRHDPKTPYDWKPWPSPSCPLLTLGQSVYERLGEYFQKDADRKAVWTTRCEEVQRRYLETLKAKELLRRQEVKRGPFKDSKDAFDYYFGDGFCCGDPDTGELHIMDDYEYQMLLANPDIVTILEDQLRKEIGKPLKSVKETIRKRGWLYPKPRERAVSK